MCVWCVCVKCVKVSYSFNNLSASQIHFSGLGMECFDEEKGSSRKWSQYQKDWRGNILSMKYLEYQLPEYQMTYYPVLSSHTSYRSAIPCFPSSLILLHIFRSSLLFPYAILSLFQLDNDDFTKNNLTAMETNEMSRAAPRNGTVRTSVLTSKLDHAHTAQSSQHVLLLRAGWSTSLRKSSLGEFLLFLVGSLRDDLPRQSLLTRSSMPCHLVWC